MITETEKRNIIDCVINTHLSPLFSQEENEEGFKDLKERVVANLEEYFRTHE